VLGKKREQLDAFKKTIRPDIELVVGKSGFLYYFGKL